MVREQPKGVSSILLLVLILILTPPSNTKTICMRPAHTSSLSQNAEKIAELIKEVSTEVTTDLIVEILLSEAGHSALLCGQAEWDQVAKNYHHCVEQVQHQLECGGQGGLCIWVQAFVDSCTGRVMGQCWTQEATLLLKRRQLEVLSNSQVVAPENCENILDKSVSFVLVNQQDKENFNSRRHLPKLKTLLGSEFLRLG